MKNVWFISKYVQVPEFGSATRQYFYSKNLSEKSYNVTLIYSISNGQSNNPKIGFKNHISFYDDKLKIVAINGSIINLGFNFKRILSWIFFEFRLLFYSIKNFKNKPDIIVVSSLSILTFLTGILLKKLFKCKLICEVRDIWPLTLIESKNISKNNLFIKFLSFIEKTAYNNADNIVGTMANLEEHVRNVSPANAKKVVYIPTGFQPSFYESEPYWENILLSMLKEIPENNFIVGYSGSIGLANCVDEIVDVAYLLKDHPISFVIVGDGPLLEDIQKKVNKMKLSNVYFFGKFPKKFVPFVLEKFDVLLNPWLSNDSLYKFGLSPNKWIEYMFSGKPIIVSVDGYQNIINEANCGVFLPGGDVKAVSEMILKYKSLSKNEIANIGLNGKEYLIKNLDYRVLCQRFENIF